MTNETAPTNSANELDLYAAEFAKLVDRYPPSRSDTPSDWLRRLPNEAFRYYQSGISTFGSKATTPIERRGRLYLMHTALLFLWMSGGKKAARERFQSEANKATQRAASVVTLERYRRAGILAQYDASEWFSTPVNDWSVRVITGALNTDRIEDPVLANVAREETTLECDVKTFSLLQDAGAIVQRDELSLE